MFSAASVCKHLGPIIKCKLRTFDYDLDGVGGLQIVYNG